MARYSRDKKGFDLLATSEEVRHFVNEVGTVYLGVLRSYAPEGTPPRDPHPGLYKASLDATTEVVELPLGPRWAAVIGAHTRYSAALEYGSKSVPNPPRPLTRLLDIVDAADPNEARKGARKRLG